MVLHGVTGCYRVLHGVDGVTWSYSVTWCKRVLHGGTWCFTLLQGFIIMVLHRLTWCYKVLEGVRFCYIHVVLQGVTWCYTVLQQQQHKLYLHDYNYLVTVLQKL